MLASCSTEHETNRIYNYIFNFFLKIFIGGCQLQVQLSQPFVFQSSKFLCLFVSKFSEFSETAPIFMIFIFLWQVTSYIIENIFTATKKLKFGLSSLTFLRHKSIFKILVLICKQIFRIFQNTQLF